MDKNTTAPTSIPQHIAIIPDGNRRWAKAKGLSTLEGHRTGGEVFRSVSRLAFQKGVQYLSVFAFSTENWNRTSDEIQYLMQLYLRSAGAELKDAVRDNIKIVVSGSKAKLSDKLLKSLDKIQQETANNTGGVLNICLNYGGKEEIVQSVKQLIESGVLAEEVTEASIKQHLYTADLPPVDVVVRTSGEKRLSNFLLWDCAYAELMFIDEMWPDFDEQSLERVLTEYAARQRRFGA